MRYLSLCSGIEAASLAWQPLGWQPVAFAEIDPFCSELLAHYWPAVPNLGDLTAVTAEQIAALGPIDLVVGGTPCQDISVAGQRAGIDGARSRLFFDLVRVFDAARAFCGARWCLWENTPGALSLNAGRDFARVVATLAGIDELSPPRGGWGNEGLALGPRGLVEWCSLDAQWFDLAQRRERVFALVDSGSWSDRPPVLLEPDRLRGDSPPSREPRAHPAGTLGRSSASGRSYGSNPITDNLIAGPLLSNSHGAGWRTGAEEAAGNHLIAEEVAEPLTTSPGGGQYTNAGNNPRPRNVVVEVASTLRAAGHDASEDGAGRQTLVPEVASTITRREMKGPDSDVTTTLVACFDETQITHPENRSTASPETAALARAARPPSVATTLTVRRLTPRECERLMGMPDDFTAIPRANGRPASDTVRYASLGNSIAVTVLRWIGEHLDAAARGGKIPGSAD